MCLLIVLSRMVPGAPLIIGANRDERLERPAEAMTLLRATAPRTLGGRDGLAGGTWLAVNERGVVAGLTNRPNPDGRDATKRSRGELPLALTAHSSAEVAVDAFLSTHHPADYNAAWLLVGDRTSLFAVDMTGETSSAVVLEPGVHGLENRAYGAASVKVEHVTALLHHLDGVGVDEVAARLWKVLADHEVPADPPDEIVDPERPPQVKAACVHTDVDYGTRWSAVVTVPDDPGARPSFAYTDGPPCTSTRQDAWPLWGLSRRTNGPSLGGRMGG